MKLKVKDKPLNVPWSSLIVQDFIKLFMKDEETTVSCIKSSEGW